MGKEMSAPIEVFNSKRKGEIMLKRGLSLFGCLSLCFGALFAEETSSEINNETRKKKKS